MSPRTAHGGPATWRTPFQAVADQPACD